MIRNYIVLLFRNFIKNGNYTAINVLGLSIGITCCVIIFLLISYELDFDRFHTKADQIYRVVRNSTSGSGLEQSGVTPYPFATAFRNDFPDVPLGTQIHDHGEALLTVNGEKQKIKDIIFADSMFFDVFDFGVVSGNPKKDLAKPGFVFITESTARNVVKGGVGTTLKLDNKLELYVAGILKDPPPTSHINYSMVVSMPSLSEDFFGLDISQWGLNSAGYYYAVLPDGITKQQVENRLIDFVKKYRENPREKIEYLLQPLREIHFDSHYHEETVDKGNLVTIGLLGVFILVIACINFINLATALAIKKSKEIGVRKTMGAVRSQLVGYFLGETFVITLTSTLLSLAAVELSLTYINSFLDKRLEQSLVGDGGLVLFLLALVFFVTLLSGLYPAIILSGYNPAAVLKNKISAQGTSGAIVRRVLVLFQFMIAQALIIGTLIIAYQMDYFRRKPLGFTRDAIVNVNMPDRKPETLNAFRDRILANSNVVTMSYSLGAPISDSGFGTGFSLADGDPTKRYDVSLKLADHSYLETYELKLLAGRYITEAEERLSAQEIPMEKRKYYFAINEAAMRRLGFEKPEDIIDKNITIGLNDITAPVIGVVEDFHTRSLRDEIMPTVLLHFPYFEFDAGIKINASNIGETLKFIEKSWTALYPDYYFEYEFLDQHVAKLYRQEERTFTLFKIFSGIAIFIGCLGLYGLISFMANQKLKEIGIRKVLGATVANVLVLFSKEFVKLILIAFVVASPLSWYFMNRWLQEFAYRIDIPWSVFAIALMATLIVAVTTVGYRALKASASNPVNALRNE